MSEWELVPLECEKCGRHIPVYAVRNYGFEDDLDTQFEDLRVCRRCFEKGDINETK